MRGVQIALRGFSILGVLQGVSMGGEWETREHAVSPRKIHHEMLGARNVTARFSEWMGVMFGSTRNSLRMLLSLFLAAGPTVISLGTNLKEVLSNCYSKYLLYFSHWL